MSAFYSQKSYREGTCRSRREYFSFTWEEKYIALLIHELLNFLNENTFSVAPLPHVNACSLMAHHAMDEHLLHPDNIAKGLDLPRSSRPRSHSLARSTRLEDVTLQAQTQLELLPTWLHNQKQPLRPLELPGWKAGSCHEV